MSRPRLNVKRLLVYTLVNALYIPILVFNIYKYVTANDPYHIFFIAIIGYILIASIVSNYCLVYRRHQLLKLTIANYIAVPVILFCTMDFTLSFGELTLLSIALLLFIDIGILLNKFLRTIILYFAILTLLLIIDWHLLEKQEYICDGLRTNELRLKHVFTGQLHNDGWNYYISVESCPHEYYYVSYKRLAIFNRMDSYEECRECW
jgi:hypothetical protein